MAETSDEGPDWVKGMADAVQTAGSAHFWDALTKSISSIVENHGIVVFRYIGGSEPALIFSNFNAQVSRGAFREYRTRAYLLDPMYLAFQERRTGGTYLLRDLTADRFFHSEYYRTYYAQTGVADELSLFCWIDADDLIMISLVRSRQSPAFPAAVVRFLKRICTLICSLVGRHVSLVPATQMPKAETALRIGGDDVLTQRESDIANLILRGHSSPSMALILGISVETIKVHRRHIYQKLAISSQAELFALAMNRPGGSDKG
jgi:DNA-binding CsgD family transcriptional regulator